MVVAARVHSSKEAPVKVVPDAWRGVFFAWATGFGETSLYRIVWNERCKAHFWLPPEAEINFELFYSIVHPDDRDRTRQAVEASVYDGQMYDIEYRTVSPKGVVRWVRATGRTVYDEHQQPVQFDGTTQDITDRKGAEAALKEADRRKDEFLAILAHELRNPLAPIRNGLQVLKLAKGNADAAEQSRFMRSRFDGMAQSLAHQLRGQ